MSCISSDIVMSLAAKYQNVNDDDDGVEMCEKFEWEDEMCSLKLSLRFYDK